MKTIKATIEVNEFGDVHQNSENGPWIESGGLYKIDDSLGIECIHCNEFFEVKNKVCFQPYQMSMSDIKKLVRHKEPNWPVRA